MARPCAADQEPTFDDFPPKGFKVNMVVTDRPLTDEECEGRRSPYVIYVIREPKAER
jgi:hypothetical protein